MRDIFLARLCSAVLMACGTGLDRARPGWAGLDWTAWMEGWMRRRNPASSSANCCSSQSALLREYGALCLLLQQRLHQTVNQTLLPRTLSL